MDSLISRQAAIDGKICIRRSNGVEIYDDYVVPVEYLMQLPPAQPAPSQVAADIARIVENGQDMRVIAQPEIIRCKDCRYGVDYYHDGNCCCAKPGYELLYFDGSWEFYCANAEREEP